ncbi:cell cycle response regulator CtrA [mine drainage metagenome]|uniref:Cell cycle response regulator CtrA n=1 Tax=mine drainage metagenome TaxID=410659 RepID=A0A1J5PHP6_9ZZZZ
MRVLLVEEDLIAARGITLMLKSAGAVVDQTDSGEDSLELLRHYEYDIVLLDLTLPDIEGFEVVRRIRIARNDTPVVVLSSIALPQARVKALSLGADDFITKPYDKAELLARMQAIVRRSKGFSQPTVRMGRLELNLDSREVLVDGRDIRLTGKGSHAAMPNLGIDPVPAACQMVQAFQTVVTRNRQPLDPAVISVTMIHAGEATNVVPESAEIQGTARTFSTETLDLIEARMRDIATHTAAAFGVDCDFEFRRNYPPTINHAAEAEFARGVMVQTVGEAAVHDFEPSMGAEDFAFMLQARPGAYLIIGNGEGGHRDAGHGLGPCTLHNPNYDFNDDLIPLGGTFWVRLATAWLARGLAAADVSSPSREFNA